MLMMLGLRLGGHVEWRQEVRLMLMMLALGRVVMQIGNRRCA